MGGGAINPIKGLPIDRRAVRNLQQIIKVVNPKSKIITGTGAFNVKGLREATNLEKYGVEHTLQSQEVRDKIQEEKQ